MLGITEVKTGKTVLVEGEPHLVLSHEHSKTGRAGAVLRTKLRNLVSGAIFDKTFQGADRLEEAEIQSSKAQYLYRDGDEFYFMDTESYEQFELSKDVLGNAPNYLIEGTEVGVLNWDGRAITVEIPVKVTLTVIEAPPNIKGDTASGGDKQVTLETGITVTTPLFVETGDKIVVNTERGTYVSRS